MQIKSLAILASIGSMLIGMPAFAGTTSGVTNSLSTEVRCIKGYSKVNYTAEQVVKGQKLSVTGSLKVDQGSFGTNSLGGQFVAGAGGASVELSSSFSRLHERGESYEGYVGRTTNVTSTVSAFSN